METAVVDQSKDAPVDTVGTVILALEKALPPVFTRKVAAKMLGGFWPSEPSPIWTAKRKGRRGFGSKGALPTSVKPSWFG